MDEASASSPAKGSQLAAEVTAAGVKKQKTQATASVMHPMMPPPLRDDDVEIDSGVDDSLTDLMFRDISEIADMLEQDDPGNSVWAFAAVSTPSLPPQLLPPPSRQYTLASATATATAIAAACSAMAFSTTGATSTG